MDETRELQERLNQRLRWFSGDFEAVAGEEEGVLVDIGYAQAGGEVWEVGAEVPRED